MVYEEWQELTIVWQGSTVDFYYDGIPVGKIVSKAFGRLSRV